MLTQTMENMDSPKRFPISFTNISIAKYRKKSPLYLRHEPEIVFLLNLFTVFS
jgi:hypothetical protein